MKFQFEAIDTGYLVSHRGRVLGSICSSQEDSGRSCFYLACDTARRPRKYRGKHHAAKALAVVNQLMASYRRNNWQIDELIAHAWNRRPATS
jgi:hypothetical protein